MDQVNPSYSSRQIVDKINTLPSLSPVVQRISKVIGDQNSSAKDVVDVLRLDPSIAGRVLRLANSAYIGMPSTVSSLQNAVVLLGIKRIHSLIFSSSILSSFKDDRNCAFDRIRFWQHSVIVALVCESIGKHLIKRHESIDPGELFCAGILHDIGKLVLATYAPDSMIASYEKANATNTPLYVNEEEEISHMTIGAMVAKQWNFPPSLVMPIVHHHTPRQTKMFKRNVAITHIADIIVHVLGMNTIENEIIPAFDESSITMIGLEEEYLKVIANNALKNKKDLESLMELFS